MLQFTPTVTAEFLARRPSWPLGMETHPAPFGLAAVGGKVIDESVAAAVAH